MPHKIICVAGMPGSGKTLVSDELVKRSFSYLRFGQITLDRLKEKGLEDNEYNERKVREEIVNKYGLAVAAILSIPKIDKLLENSDVVIDGLYTWSDYKLLKEKYGKLMYVVAVFAPPELRYERLTSRKEEKDKDMRFRSYTHEEAKARDFAEIEKLEKGGPIAMADFTIINTGTIEKLKSDINDILSQIK